MLELYGYFCVTFNVFWCASIKVYIYLEWCWVFFIGVLFSVIVHALLNRMALKRLAVSIMHINRGYQQC